MQGEIRNATINVFFRNKPNEPGTFFILHE